ncbi:MAG: hypothetical protein K2X94_01605, partial [Amoebophilaceae bacterium]|nr:hypothetical protein [Amoebophilaceae bacterium]
AANVTWFPGAGAALVSMSASNNPLTFSATVGGSTTVTVTNIGGYTLNNVIIPDPIILGGSATATLSNNNCNAISLAIGASCSYDVNVADSATDLNQQINLGFNASYTNPSGMQSYTQSMVLTYSSTAYGAILSVSPTNPRMTISGNDLESANQILTISNNGNLPATISSALLSNNPSYLSESATSCGASLAAESSCTSTLQLGPVFSKTESSGVANYTVNYTSVGQTPAGSASNAIAWTVQSYDQSISLSAQTAFGSTSGDGESEASQYNFTARGRDLVGKSITLTYTNIGTHAMKITGIQDSNSPITWKIGGNGTSCIAGTTLAPAATCQLVYTNVLESNILALGAVGTSYSENLSLPRFVYQDVDNPGVQFNAIPNLANSSYVIYAQSHQATLANSITLNESGTINANVTVSHLLANADDALNVTVTTQMEDYFEIAPGDGGSAACTYNSANGIMTQTCIMGKDDLSMSATYRINPNYLNQNPLLLTALFSLDGLSQIASMNPLAINLNLGTIPNFVAVGTNGTIIYSQDGVSWESTTFGTDYINGVTFADNKYVAVGQNGAVYTSNNAMNWVAQLSGTSQELFEVTYGNNLFVSVGCTGTIITSPTGVNWSLQTGINSCDIYGVTYGNGLYVATGQGGYIQTSPDATTWTEQNSTTNQELTAVSYGNGKYIAVGANGTIVYSTDGVVWNAATSGVTAQIGAVLYANNQYVAVTREGGVITSADGVTWSSQTSSNINPLYGIAYAQGKFVAVGSNGTVLTSVDGITWEAQNSNTSENLYGIASVN